GLHVLVNNAGILVDRDGSIAELSLEAFDETLRVNLRGAFLLCQLALPSLRRAGWGRIVNVSTGLSRLTDGMGAGYSAYRISSTALNALTATLASELRGTRILVNAVDPGWVRTRMGGAGAARAVEQGADTVIWAATLPDEGPTGQLLRDRQPSPF